VGYKVKDKNIIDILFAAVNVFCEIVRIAEAEPPYSFQTTKLRGKKGELLSG
jgi:hypothetical protein